MNHVLVLGHGPQSAALPLPSHLREIAATDIDWRLGNTRVGGFPYTALDALMTETGHVDAALRLRDADTRAVLVDTFGEYGLAAMRSALDIPVVGSAEAVLAEARQHGERFGIVTVWPASLDWLYRRQLLLHESAQRCVGIQYVGDSVADQPQPVETLGAMRRGEPQWLALIEAGIDKLVAQGARSIVLGCTCMSPVWNQLQARVSVPVLCAARAGARAALVAARGGTAQPPTASRATQAAFTRWVDQGADATPADDAASCPVCITEPQ